MGCPVNWSLPFLQSVVFGWKSQAALWLVMPAARYFPEKESTQSSPGDTPGPPPFNLDVPSIARRRQGVRYALLAPLPLPSHRAGISALTVQAPGLCGPCGWLTQLVGTRRGA